jgi:hypothetical protein
MKDYETAIRACSVPVSPDALRDDVARNENVNVVISFFSLANIVLRWLSDDQLFELLVLNGENLQTAIENVFVPKAKEVLAFLRRVLSPNDASLRASAKLRLCVVLKSNNVTAEKLKEIVEVILFADFFALFFFFFVCFLLSPRKNIYVVVVDEQAVDANDSVEKTYEHLVKRVKEALKQFCQGARRATVSNQPFSDVPAADVEYDNTDIHRFAKAQSSMPLSHEFLMLVFHRLVQVAKSDFAPFFFFVAILFLAHFFFLFCVSDVVLISSSLFFDLQL